MDETEVMAKRFFTAKKICMLLVFCVKQQLKPMRSLFTCLQGKLAKMYFSFKKFYEIIKIYEETCETPGESFQ